MDTSFFSLVSLRGPEFMHPESIRRPWLGVLRSAGRGD